VPARSPANGSTGRPTSLTLSWNASSGATSYRLQVSTVSTFSSTVVDDATLTTTSRVVSSLANNTLYYWRVSASNGAGSSAFSGAWSFTTVALLPSATTSAATSVTTSSATLNGSVNPNGATTTAWFEWGTSSTLSTYTSTTALSAGNGVTAVAQSSNLTGLAAGATYYFRMAAQNSAGTTRGSIVSFTTTAAGTPSFAVSPTSINFGTVKLGKSKKDSVVVTNAGGATLTISSITSNSARFVVSPVSGSVPAGGSLKVYITYTPADKSLPTGTISFAQCCGIPGTVSVSGRGGSGRQIRPDDLLKRRPSDRLCGGAELSEPVQPHDNDRASPRRSEPGASDGVQQHRAEVALLADGQFDAANRQCSGCFGGLRKRAAVGHLLLPHFATSLVSGEEFQSVRRMILMK
jgi:hypothetical protein